jgi:hypothetical protein
MALIGDLLCLRLHPRSGNVAEDKPGPASGIQTPYHKVLNSRNARGRCVVKKVREIVLHRCLSEGYTCVRVYE